MLRAIFEETCSKIIYFCNKLSLAGGICIHCPLIKLGLQENLFLNNNLLSLYSKCYGVETARHFFDEMPYRDVVSWTGMLSSYVRNGRHEEALEFFDLMKFSDEIPNEFTLSSALKSCLALGHLGYGTKVQAFMTKLGFDSNTVLCSSLIELYAECGCLKEAYRVFSGMANGDTISWTTVISSFVQAGKWIEALRLFVYMIETGVCPNEYTFVKLLTACAYLGINVGRLVHAQLVIRGIQLNLVLKTALVDMYAKCHKLEDALNVLWQTSEQDVQLWTTIISGFNQNSKFEEAIGAFCHMVGNGIVPNTYTYAGILNACSSIQSLDIGKQIHSKLIVAGVDNDISTGNALINLYTKCSNSIEDAIQAFRRITEPNVISWTSLISGLAEHGHEDGSFRAFEEMRFLGHQPNSFTFSSVLQVCRTIKSRNHTRKIHAYIIKTNADNDLVVGNALIDAYAGIHMVGSAWCVLEAMSQRNVVTYTVLASRLNQMGYHRIVLDVANDMLNNHVKIDGFSLTSFLSASANLGAIQAGKQLHCYSLKSGLSSWISVSNSLIDMYGKCKCVHNSQKAFNEINEPDVVSWNSLILASASSGHITSALSTFEDMRLAGARPDSVTLWIVLFACSEGGLVDMALEYFNTLRGVYNVEPGLNHYIILVDLLGGVGRLEEAVDVVKTIPLKPNALIYKTLLGASRVHKRISLGEDIARQGLELDPLDTEFYYILASMYDEAGQIDLGNNMRKLMKEKQVRKNDGRSLMRNIEQGQFKLSRTQRPSTSS